MKRIILDLCGFSGEWSKPYREAGYDVRIIDPKVKPGYSVLDYAPPSDVYGVLAAPPCTDFAGSGAQYWKAKDKDGRTIKSLAVVLGCLRIIAETRPKFWALENPVGRLRRWMGNPAMIFQPWHYGDPYTKKTLLWGNFAIPKANPIKPVKVCPQGSWVQRLGGKSEKTKTLRSITPGGFAKAFFQANK